MGERCAISYLPIKDKEEVRILYVNKEENIPVVFPIKTAIDYNSHEFMYNNDILTFNIWHKTFCAYNKRIKKNTKNCNWYNREQIYLSSPRKSSEEDKLIPKKSEVKSLLYKIDPIIHPNGFLYRKEKPFFLFVSNIANNLLSSVIEACKDNYDYHLSPPNIHYALGKNKSNILLMPKKKDGFVYDHKQNKKTEAKLIFIKDSFYQSLLQNTVNTKDNYIDYVNLCRNLLLDIRSKKKSFYDVIYSMGTRSNLSKLPEIKNNKYLSVFFSILSEIDLSNDEIDFYSQMIGEFEFILAYLKSFQFKWIFHENDSYDEIKLVNSNYIDFVKNIIIVDSRSEEVYVDDFK